MLHFMVLAHVNSALPEEEAQGSTTMTRRVALAAKPPTALVATYTRANGPVVTAEVKLEGRGVRRVTGTDPVTGSRAKAPAEKEDSWEMPSRTESLVREINTKFKERGVTWVNPF